MPGLLAAGYGYKGLLAVSVLEIFLLVALLAFYLAWVGTLLTRIAGNLETCDETVKTIDGHADAIAPGLAHINRTGGIVAGALPLLYNFSEGIVKGVTPMPAAPAEPVPARPASMRRRSRLHDAVGYEQN
ncbi:MAG: hypothetical protein ACRD0E_02125 [Acidimicrobiales bacterium]